MTHQSAQISKRNAEGLGKLGSRKKGSQAPVDVRQQIGHVDDTKLAKLNSFRVVERQFLAPVQSTQGIQPLPIDSPGRRAIASYVSVFESRPLN